MKLTLAEACRLLGQTARQVRYLIKTGKVRAHKEGGRWLIEEASLPRTPADRRAAAAKATELRAAVDAALAPRVQGRRYSVRDVRAFERGLDCCRRARELLGDRPAADMIRDSLVVLTQACHRFHDREKAAGFRDARERAAAALALLHLEGSPEAAGLADAIEQDYLPLIAGLLRRSERRGQP